VRPLPIPARAALRAEVHKLCVDSEREKMMTLLDFVQVVYFFGPAYAADVSPIVAERLFPKFHAPIDGGMTLRGRPLLGAHKTWRGFLACVVAGVTVWEGQRILYRMGLCRELALVDYAAEPLLPGLLMGVGAGIGDTVKSLLKRQVGIAPGAPWLGFDQLDFFLGALACVSLVHVPPLRVVLAVMPLVFVCDIAATTICWLVGLKQSWI
jgi:CDP-2,3-bis-(O-geranylgeranyl)-sn-glycerol synthase